MSDNLTPSSKAWLAALGSSQRRLSAVVATLTPDQIAGPSYAGEWSTAQVMSHLGSGAQIMTMHLDAGLEGRPAPGIEAIQPVWQRWDAKSPLEATRDGLAASSEFVDRVSALDGGRARSWQLEMFGGLRHFDDLLRFRLGELAVHSWDVEVVQDPVAGIDPAATELIVDTLEQIASFGAKAPEKPLVVHVSTVGPTRHFELRSTGDSVSIVAATSDEPDEGQALLRLPAEALIRLVYGRLDLQHTPPLVAERIDLNVLRSTFPGV